MKYFVFMVAALGVLPLSFLLFINMRWIKWLFFGIAVSICLYETTAINFFSHEEYRGTARGMEVSLAYLLSLAMLIALFARGKSKGWFPEVGFKLFLPYFLLCLPSLASAADCLISWFEIWKMMMLYIVYLATCTYLNATDDLKTILWMFCILVLVNMALVGISHYSGVYQPHGFFPHRNSMAMAMQLFGNLFFASYLVNGTRTFFGKMSLLACGSAVLCTLWSFSRGAIAILPVAYSVTAIACLCEKKGTMMKFKRIIPIFIIGLFVSAAALPRIIDRFVNAPKSSGNTRVELAYCAKEMISDEPLRGVGINNWSIMMAPPYRYQDQASEALGVDLEYTGIVETVYLLVAAECGIPALIAMLVWFAWYWISCLRLVRRLRGTRWFFVAAGLLGGLTAQYLQSALEWVLRQQRNMIILLISFAIISYLNMSWRKLESKR